MVVVNSAWIMNAVAIWLIIWYEPLAALSYSLFSGCLSSFSPFEIVIFFGFPVIEQIRIMTSSFKHPKVLLQSLSCVT